MATPPPKRRRVVGEVGEVRYAMPESAQLAVERLDGSSFSGSTISVMLDGASQDCTKIVVYGLPYGTQRQRLKEYFARLGSVNFAAVLAGRERDPGQGQVGSQHGEVGQLVAPKVEVEHDLEGAVGEVRFDSPEDAQEAINKLHGSLLEESAISVEPHETSADGTKLLVKGLPLGIEWQELKDHFASVGTVAFASIRPPTMPAGSEAAAPPEPGSGVGELRYDAPADARMAMAQLNGSTLQGYPLTLQLDGTSKDGTKLIVYGLAPGVHWQEMKDHFSQIGVVAYANVMSRGVAAPAGRGRAGPGRAGAPGAAPAGLMGEVRYDTEEDAVRAAEELDGGVLLGATIHVQLDASSKDKSKCLVHGLPPGLEWQELKDHFSVIGRVAFASVVRLLPASGQSLGPAAEVRYDNAADAERAIAEFNGAEVAGCCLSVEKAPLSHDGAKLWVRNLPPTYKWQELKDIFQQVGRVAFAEVRK